jgi:Ala-tRNA(Pro) deacylase
MSFSTRPKKVVAGNHGSNIVKSDGKNFWSGRRDSNPRPQPWQGCALPLSYTRIQKGMAALPPGECYAKRLVLLQRPWLRVDPLPAKLSKSTLWSKSTTAKALFSMAATPDDLFAFLDALGIAHATVKHAPLFTVEQSQALRGSIPGGHTKNLFLKDKKGALVLLTALEDAEIELKSLHRRIGGRGRFSFGSAELMRETLGIEPGAVTPFAAMNDRDRRVSVILDADLMRHVTLNCHPLRNTMTTSIAFSDLVKFLDATGHPPLIVELAQAREQAKECGS